MIRERPVMKTAKNANQEPPQFLDVLGCRYVLPLLEGGNLTKERILMTSTILFARKGYAAVSMRDIATAAGIKPSSLYNHFENKENLWAEALEHLKKLHILYFEHLVQTLAQADSFEDMMAGLFYEPRRQANIFASYGFSLVMQEQVHDPKAAETFNFFISRALGVIKGCFDDCVARGLVPAFDTHTATILILNNAFMGLTAQVQENEGRRMPYKTKDMFDGMERFFLEHLARK